MHGKEACKTRDKTVSRQGLSLTAKGSTSVLILSHLMPKHCVLNWPTGDPLFPSGQFMLLADRCKISSTGCTAVCSGT